MRKERWYRRSHIPIGLELSICLSILVCGVVLAFAPDTWPTMMVRAFMFQWSIVFAILAALVLARTLRLVGICALGALTLSATQLKSVTNGSISAGTAGLRILHMNVLQPNLRHAEIIERALACDADVIAVQEVDEEWAAALSKGLKGYPYRVIEPRSNCYGIAMFSRVPWYNATIKDLQGTPLVEASISTDQGPVKVMSAHATSPNSEHHYRKRNRQLRALADRIRNEPLPVVLVGDLNTVHWDDAYHEFSRGSGSRSVNSTQLRTWPALGPIALIPIDHIFLTGGLTCTALRRIPLPGSDHFGLMAEIGS